MRDKPSSTLIAKRMVIRSRLADLNATGLEKPLMKQLKLRKAPDSKNYIY